MLARGSLEGFCMYTHNGHVGAIPTYRVYWLSSTTKTHMQLTYIHIWDMQGQMYSINVRTCTYYVNIILNAYACAMLHPYHTCCLMTIFNIHRSWSVPTTSNINRIAFTKLVLAVNTLYQLTARCGEKDEVYLALISADHNLSLIRAHPTKSILLLLDLLTSICIHVTNSSSWYFSHIYSWWHFKNTCLHSLKIYYLPLTNSLIVYN